MPTRGFETPTRPTSDGLPTQSEEVCTATTSGTAEWKRQPTLRGCAQPTVKRASARKRENCAACYASILLHSSVIHSAL
jgi:hypothetical protein